MPTLSIIIPGIRPYNWEALYASIKNTSQEDIEVIFVGPFLLPEPLTKYANIKYIKDFGSAVRAQQIGTLFAEGNLITWGADDAIYLPDALDEAITLLKESSKEKICVGRYYEGRNGIVKTKQPDQYFRLNNYSPLAKFADPSWWMFQPAIMHRETFIELGGLDCKFEVGCCSHADFAMRSYRSGCEVTMLNNFILDCDHGHLDHGPIEDAQNNHDWQLLIDIYKDESCLERIYVPYDNWQTAERVWSRRFKIET